VWKNNEFDIELSAMRRLVGKLKVLKQKVRGWVKNQKELRLQELVAIEEELENSYSSKTSGRVSMDIDSYIKEMERKRQKFLLDEEETWRQKSREIWL
jgi:hypothetical protein